MNRPCIQVIIPVYGREDVFTTLAFLRKQPYADVLRFIVVDNGNGVDLSGRLKALEDGNCQVISFPENRGGSAAYREGMLVALRENRADYLWLLDDDALPEERTLPELLAVFDEAAASGSGPVGVVGSAMLGRRCPRRITEAGCFVSRLTGLMRRCHEGEDVDRVGASTYDVDYCAAASLLVRMDVVRKVGVFEDLFIHQDDVDWCFRIHEAGFRVLATTRSTVSHPDDDDRFALWQFYFNTRNKRWMVDRHLPWFTRLGIRFLQQAYRLAFRYHGMHSAAGLMSLGMRHAKTGELLMRRELPIGQVWESIAELVTDADFIGVLAAREKVADALLKELVAAGVRNPHAAVRQRCHGPFAPLRMAFAHLALQVRVWRARRPVVFQDCFCIGSYPLRLFCSNRHFFAAANGQVSLVPDRLLTNVLPGRSK